MNVSQELNTALESWSQMVKSEVESRVTESSLGSLLTTIRLLRIYTGFLQHYLDEPTQFLVHPREYNSSLNAFDGWSMDFNEDSMKSGPLNHQYDALTLLGTLNESRGDDVVFRLALVKIWHHLRLITDKESMNLSLVIALLVQENSVS